MKSFLNMLAIAALVMSGVAVAGEIDPAKVSEKKQTPQKLYLSAKETREFISKENGKVLFLDVRTQPEVEFVGMADGVDANIPYVMTELNEWDDKKNVFKKQANSNFLVEVKKRLSKKNLDQDAKIVLICRSGDRAANAAALLDKAGYKNVYSVVDGFEGDLAGDGPNKGKRAVNGWKNAGLPWGYELSKDKMYFDL